ncbi:nucleotidyltransferase domain-containing protein [Paramicrobacterium fandaimingii]|uniref:nucleotidyltransferase domain-containing protein n=1 Tax=Paramicrobacterium fandaimingii TaxID=2708079 RepID=UPI001423AE2B|nr:nucleotidyltransferase domain-containing protein [Microbacterium fandaimingii]
MQLVDEYFNAQRSEGISRLRRVIALRAMIATGMTQRRIADVLGITQPAVSQQLKFAPDLGSVHPEMLLESAAEILKTVAEERGYSSLAVFGSTARGEAESGSDIDLLVQAPTGTSSFAFVQFKQLIEQILGRKVDLVSYGGLKPHLDNDIREEAVLL